MKIKFLLASVCLLMSTIVFAELSGNSMQRIKQGISRCDEVNNELIYKKYWRDTVKPENLKSVCMAEQFADQVAKDGEPWLKSNASGLIDLCRSQSDDQKLYLSCLKTSLEKVAKELANPCVELEIEKLWDEDKCRRLVSYIFMTIFETINEVTEPPQAKVFQSPPVVITEPELSLASTWRIEQAIERCDRSNNELIYKNYWKDSVKPENKKTVCIAEQFAGQLTADGDAWLENDSANLVKQCEVQGRKNKNIYQLCLQRNLENKIKILSLPCKELGEKKLWDERKCKRLVSYIFITKFENVIESQKPLLGRFKHALDRMNEITLVRYLVNPVTAILVFIAFAFDVIFLIEKGTWMRLMKTSYFLGPLILLTCFAKGGMRLLSSGLVMVITIMLIIWNHQRNTVKLDKKKPTPIEF